MREPAIACLWLAGLCCACPASDRDHAGSGPASAVPREELLSSGLRVFVREIRFRGNRVFSAADLAGVVAPYVNRALASEDLEEARVALTRHYIDRGYINSGAVLEDQPVRDGVIVFTIVEGQLEQVRVKGNRWLRSGYIRNRLFQKSEPLNLGRLNERLLLLRDNPNVRRVNAELQPGTVRGLARLEVAVEEEHPWHAAFVLQNDRPPSVGAETLELAMSHQSLLGYSDALALHYGIAERSAEGVDFSGLDNVEASYTLPVNRLEATVQAYVDRENYALFEEPFDLLDISGQSITAGLRFRQPLYRSTRREVAMGVVGEWRQSKTFLWDDPFSLAPGAVNGESTETVFRFFAEWIERNQRRVIALRSTLSLGTDLLGATDNGTDRDGQFFSFLGQGQYVRRLWDGPSQLIFNVTGQWANDPLLALEQFSLGGINTVRGYRENQMVRDMGLVASVELRVPVLFSRSRDPLLQLAPFLDYGAGWNIQAPTPDDSNLTSAGLGLLLDLGRTVSARLYWGYAFRQFDYQDEDLQDYGLHFRINASLF